MSLRHGVDVSAYQAGDVLETLPVLDFALVKVSEGGRYTSPRFPVQWKSARTRARRRGGYHFARPEESSAHDQCSRFLDLLQPSAGEIVMLDLEASLLTRDATNRWARDFGNELAGQAPGVASWLYMGAGYAATSTGAGLAGHFRRWMYPQYPSAYQLAPGGPDVEARRAANRSSLVPERTPIARATTAWPASMAPWLPSGVAATGWTEPDVWQFTDRLGAAGLDASVSALTIDQLADGGQQPSEDDMAYAGVPPLAVGERISQPTTAGPINTVSLWFDSPNRLTYRIAMHSKKGHGDIEQKLTVGGPASATDSWPAVESWRTGLGDVDGISIELVEIAGPDVDKNPAWTPAMPDVTGRVVRPGWDASHT